MSTESLRSLKKRALRVLGPEELEPTFSRPRVRLDCESCDECQRWRDDPDGTTFPLACGHSLDDAIRHSRPCVFVGCRANTFAEVTRFGSLRYVQGDMGPDGVPAEWSCAIDAGDTGSIPRIEIARVFRVTEEAVRQIVNKSLESLRGRGDVEALAEQSGIETKAAPTAAEPSAEEESSPEADAFADRVLALRVEGVPLERAWSLADGCDLSEEREMIDMGASNGAAVNGASHAGDVEDEPRTLAEQIAKVERERAALKAMIEREESKLAEQQAALARAKEALGEPSPTARADANPRGVDDASSAARADAKTRGRAPSPWGPVERASLRSSRRTRDRPRARSPMRSGSPLARSPRCSMA